MLYFSREELDHDSASQLREYDASVRASAGADFRWPLRMRDWELLRILDGVRTLPPGARILEIGSYNTYLAAYLARRGYQVTASDRLAHRWLKNIERKLGFAPAKPTEAPYGAWKSVLTRAGVKVRSYDATRLPLPDGFFDAVIALSVLEHIPAIESALAELYRVTAPGGRLLLTIDAAPQPIPYRSGVRYFSPEELERLFRPYSVTSPRRAPEFTPENRCYGSADLVLPAFVEVTKPA